MTDGRARPGDGRDLLTALGGVPRPAGSAAEARARALCATRLQALGFELTERPFTYSTIPGRWGTPAAGVVLAVAIASATLLGDAGRSLAALSVLLAALALTGVAGSWLARHGTTRLRAARAQGVNLEARPATYGGEREPAVWLVAHLDSKSQPVPMLLRAGGIVVTALVLAILLVLAAATLDGGVSMLWKPLGVLGTIAALPIVATTVGSRSAGALDNASGVASVLAAAERIPPTLPVGVLITSAEELGLAGARAWVEAKGPVRSATLLNCDGVDDRGMLVLMYSGRRPDALLARATRAADGDGLQVRVSRLVPGVLVDAVAFADAGLETVTVSRGTLRTLARIHRPTDDLTHLRGDGIEDAARLLAAVAIDLAEG